MVARGSAEGSDGGPSDPNGAIGLSEWPKRWVADAKRPWCCALAARGRAAAYTCQCRGLGRPASIQRGHDELDDSEDRLLVTQLRVKASQHVDRHAHYGAAQGAGGTGGVAALEGEQSDRAPRVSRLSVRRGDLIHRSVPVTYNDIHVAVQEAAKRVQAEFGQSRRKRETLLSSELSSAAPTLMIALGSGGFIPARMLRTWCRVTNGQGKKRDIPILSVGLTRYAEVGDVHPISRRTIR